MLEYKFPNENVALAFLKTQELCLFGASNVVPANLKNYPTYSRSNTPRSIAHLYSDKLNFNINTRYMRAPALSVLRKYQTRLKRALKRENIPSVDI